METAQGAFIADNSSPASVPVGFPDICDVYNQNNPDKSVTVYLPTYGEGGLVNGNIQGYSVQYCAIPPSTFCDGIPLKVYCCQTRPILVPIVASLNLNTVVSIQW